MKARQPLSLLLALCLTLSVCTAAEAQEWDVVWLEPDVRSFSHMSEGLLEVYGPTGMGYVDAAGQVVIPLEYIAGNISAPFSDGLVGVGRLDPLTDEVKFGFIDHQGETVIPFLYDDTMGFSEGLACVGLWNAETAHWDEFYIDTTGKVVIPPNDAYDVTYGFCEGMARVRLGGVLQEVDLWGYIDKTGELVIPCVYDAAEDYSEGLAAVGWCDENGDWAAGYLDSEGSLVMGAYGVYLGDFSEGLATVDHSYFVDKEGEVALIPDYGSVGEFHMGRAAVLEYGETDEDGKMGFIDRAGNTVIPCIYDDCEDFSEGLAAVCRKEGETEKWGYVDRFGREVIPLIFDSVQSFSEGVAVVERDGRYGLLRLHRTAYPSTQSVLVDGKPVTFNAYALKDENGNDTNYIKLRDVADILNGSAAQFAVGWDGSITITTKTAYTPNGSENIANFSGNQSYTVNTSPVKVDGAVSDLEAITLTDASGGGYTYFKLRDLGAALGFNVSWDAGSGISIDSTRPYDPAN